MIGRLVLLLQTGFKLSHLLSFQGSIADTRANSSRNAPIMNVQMWGIKSAPSMALLMKFSTPEAEESLVSLEWSITNFTSFFWIDLWGIIPLFLTRKSTCSFPGIFCPSPKGWVCDFQIRGPAAMFFQVLLV